jgi:hypothetical protein
MFFLAALVTSGLAGGKGVDQVPTNSAAPRTIGTNIWADMIWAGPTNSLYMGAMAHELTARLYLMSIAPTNVQSLWIAPPGFPRFEAELRDATQGKVPSRSILGGPNQAAYTNLSRVPRDKHGVPVGRLWPPRGRPRPYAEINVLDTFQITNAGEYILSIEGRIMEINTNNQNLTTEEFPRIVLGIHVRQEDLASGPR